MGASKKPLGRNGYKYREQYGVIAVCRDAQHQEQVFKALKQQGLKVKVVTV